MAGRGGRRSTTWQPGQSGCSDGASAERPPTWHEFRRELRSAAPAAAAELSRRIREDARDMRTGDLVRLVQLWASYAWGTPIAVAPDGDLPADIASRSPDEQAWWLEQRLAQYQQALEAIRPRTRGASQSSVARQEQDQAVEDLIAEREARH